MADGDDLNRMSGAASSAESSGDICSDSSLAEILAGLIPDKNGGSADKSEAPEVRPSAGKNIFSLMSLLMQGLDGEGSLIKPEKLNLVLALKPYMNESHSKDIDRAIKMANMARAAKSALSALGR